MVRSKLQSLGGEKSTTVMGWGGKKSVWDGVARSKSGMGWQEVSLGWGGKKSVTILLHFQLPLKACQNSNQHSY